MLKKCIIAQPIHPIGAQLMREAGIEVIQSPNSSLDALRDLVHDADAVIIRDKFPADVIDIAPKLKVIANHGTGFDKIDVDHAAQVGIPVTYTPETNVRAVAEHAFMLMLATARQAATADKAARAGDWLIKYKLPMQSLFGKTLGIIGWGHTGRLLCDMVKGLNMSVIVWSPSASPEKIEAHGARVMSSLHELLAAADVVSLHRPLRADTKHTINAEALSQMKPSAILINTARGGLIDEKALVTALREKRIFGAGLDVFEHEPLLASADITTLDNVVITPHLAGSTEEAAMATATQCAEQIIAVLNETEPVNLVRPQVWAQRRSLTAQS